MLSETDISLWESIKKTLKPLVSGRVKEPRSLPKKLKVHAVPERTLITTLDLHGMTVEDAYQTLKRFISVHERAESRVITVVTGKGSAQKEGLIHHEIQNWLETKFFQDKIQTVRWLNGGGALEIRLKRKKNK